MFRSFRMSRLAPLAPMALYCGCLLSSSAALAQGDGRLPPPPLPTAINGAPASLGGPAPGGMPPAPMPAPVPVNTADLKIEPGACESERRALLGRILEAKSQNIGISTYMMVFDDMEQRAKGGETAENLAKRVASLNSSLDDQFKRSAILKVQRATPPVAASPASVPLGGSMGTPPGNTDTAALIQKLQSKYGGQIPDDLKGKIPGGDPSALLKNPEIMDILKGLKK